MNTSMKRFKQEIAALLVSLAIASIGWAGDGVVALQSADPSCRDDSASIYVDCGNGTVTDNRTGLVWLQNGDCLDGAVDWVTASNFVAGLADMPPSSDAAAHDCGLSDGSSPGEWRLPSIGEWEDMVALGIALDCHPAITNDLANSCWSLLCHTSGTCAFNGVYSAFYWSSTPAVTAAASSFGVDLEFGLVGFGSQAGTRLVWPVRGGQ